MLADRGTCAEVRHTLAVVCRAPGAHLELPLSAAERRRAQNQGLTVAYSGAHLVFLCCLKPWQLPGSPFCAEIDPQDRCSVSGGIYGESVSFIGTNSVTSTLLWIRLPKPRGCV